MNNLAVRRQTSEASERTGARAAVRPYRLGDREAVRRICCETGYLGRPVDPLFRDRDLFADLMTGPYIDAEPEWAWVAEKDGAVVGYLMASVSPSFGQRQLRTGARAVGRMFCRMMTGRYAGHPRSLGYIRWLVFRAVRERPRHPPGAAHLHFNLLDGARGRLGFHLWHAFDRQLREAGIGDLYGEFFSYPGHRPEEVYARYGFEVFDRRETTLFQGDIAAPVEIVCTRRLTPACRETP